MLRALMHAGAVDHPRVIEALASRLARGKDVPAITLFRVIGEAGLADRAPILDAMHARMRGRDDEIFRFYVAELDAAGVWGWPDVPIDLWMRSIEMLLSDPAPMARVLGVQRLADMHLMACDPAVLKMLEQAATDADLGIAVPVQDPIEELDGLGPSQA